MQQFCPSFRAFFIFESTLLPWKHSFIMCIVFGKLWHRSPSDRSVVHRTWVTDKLSVYSHVYRVFSLNTFSCVCRGRGAVFQRCECWSSAIWGDICSRKWKQVAVRFDSTTKLFASGEFVQNCRTLKSAAGQQVMCSLECCCYYFRKTKDKTLFSCF